MTYRQRVREYARDRYGYITTAQAAALGVPVVELRKLAARGALTHVSRGLYRLADALATDRDQFAEAVLRVGPDAYLTHDAVLALHGLALIDPHRIRVGTPRRVRVKLPGYVELILRDLPAGALAEYEAIPCTTVAQALVDCRGVVLADRLAQATKRACAEGLLTTREMRLLNAQGAA